MRESLVERKLKDEVEKAGGLCWKFTSTTDGVPDRIILLYPGRVIFAETKAEGGRLREIQKVRIRKLEDLGFRVKVIHSKEEIRELMSEIKEEGARRAEIETTKTQIAKIEKGGESDGV